MLFTSLPILSLPPHPHVAMGNAIIYEFLGRKPFTLAFSLIQQICVPTKGKIVY